MAQIRVLIVEDCPPILEGLKTVLAREADIAVVGEALSGQEALRLVEELGPRRGAAEHDIAGHGWAGGAAALTGAPSRGTSADDGCLWVRI